jgi:uncharacterized hydrophobic protein (TIGR00271 family)
MYRNTDFLLKRAKEESQLDQDLVLLTFFSTIIAVFGVKNSSIIVLMGAMLVAPMFDPVISMSVFLFSRNWKKMILAMKSFSFAVLVTIFTSMLFFFLFRTMGREVDLGFLGNPDLLDTIMLALVLGMVGTLLWIWPKTSNTSAGVAVAISLVPPLVASIAGLVYGDKSAFLTFMSVFILNLIGILMGSQFILYLYSRGNKKHEL